MKYFYVFCIYLAVLDAGAQTLISFADPWQGATKTAMAWDSAGGYYYFTTAQSFNPHNKWKLFRYNTSTQIFDSLAGSGFGPASVTNKMLYRGGKLFLLQDEIRIRCFDLSSAQWTWDVNVDNPGWERIKDFSIAGDTIFLGGDFSGLNSIPRWSIAAINKNNGAIINGWDPSFGGNYDFAGIQCVESGSMLLYVGGSFVVNGKQNLLSINIASESITTWSPQPNDSIYDLEVNSGHLYVCGKFTVIHGSGRNRLARINLPGHTLNTFTSGANGVIDDIEVHPGLLVVNGSFTQLGSQARPGMGSFSLLTNQVTSWNPGSTARSARPLKTGDRLFICQTYDPTWKTYCLSPGPGLALISPDTTACKNDTNIYILNLPAYTSSTVWSYSGAGVTLNPTLNSCLLYFGSNATSGTLTATPFSSCGSAGASANVNITVQPIPYCQSTNSVTLNCMVTGTWITGNSAPNSIAWWTGPYNCPPDCDSMFVTSGGQYIFHVKDTISTCRNRDTTTVILDTLRPNVTLPSGTFMLGCGGQPLLLDGSSSTPNTGLVWHDAFNLTLLPDPALISAPGLWWLVATNNQNGCKDSAWLAVGLNVNAPNASLISVPDIFPSVSAYYTCATDSILLQGASDSLNTTLFWRSISDQALHPNPFYATTTGIYTLIVIDTVNGCADSSKLVLLAYDTLPPLYQLPSVNFNCSADSILLDAMIMSPATTLFWITPQNDTIPDSSFIQIPGIYKAVVTRSGNGCESIDSTSVGFDPTILFSNGSDTLVCMGANLTLSPDPIGNFGTLYYSWDDNSTGATRDVIVNGNGVFWVDVSDSAGCSGRDSFYISVAPLISDSLLLFSSCDGSDSGSVIINVLSGIPPYQFSLDGGNTFFSSTSVNNLPYGIYTLIIRDSLGCTSTDSFSLGSTSLAPTAAFLCTEELYVGDTIQPVDMSLPVPDTILWSFSGPINVLNSTSGSFLCLDTGMVTVNLTAQYPGCQISAQRIFSIDPYDSTLATPYNENKIKSVRVFPNPNNGSFNIEVECYKKQDLVVEVTDAAGNVLHLDQLRDLLFYTYYISWSNSPGGIYRLTVTSEFDQASFLFILSP